MSKLTLDEAIKHCNEQVELLQRKADYTVFSNISDKDQCIECANDHRQLAEWLKELQKLKGSKCPFCGKYGAINFCPHCGNRLIY